MGGGEGWSYTSTRQIAIESIGLGRFPIMTLSSALAESENSDLSLHFNAPLATEFRDTNGNYVITVDPSVSVADSRYARRGDGAALFVSEGGIRVKASRDPSLFLSPGVKDGDFTIEFWLYPATGGTGEQVFVWSALQQQNILDVAAQSARCAIDKNGLKWSFTGFFLNGNGDNTVELTLFSQPLTPKVWSHHLIRFDSKIGLIEYLVNGQIVSLVYATATGQEGGEPYFPFIGDSGILIIGSNYNGMIDEFNISRHWVEKPELKRYPSSGGRMETAPLDLGYSNSLIGSLETKSSTPGECALIFYLRCSDYQYFTSGEELEWIPVAAGVDLGENFHGRWAQVAVDFFPDSSGETAPVLEELRLRFTPDEPPAAPSSLTAIAGDSRVELFWKQSPDADVAGYLVYFGDAPGNYWGHSELSGNSPINVGANTSFTIKGLRNDALYFFTVAAYDKASPPHIGVFSRERSARPVRTTLP